MGMKQESSRSFSWTDREVQPAYELIRQGKMPQSDSLLGRARIAWLRPPRRGAAEARINGSKLPGFDFVSKALGPSTAAMTSEPDGWFIKGFFSAK